MFISNITYEAENRQLFHSYIVGIEGVTPVAFIISQDF